MPDEEGKGSCSEGNLVLPPEESHVADSSEEETHCNCADMLVGLPEGEQLDDENEDGDCLDILQAVIEVVGISDVVEDGKDDVEEIEDKVKAAVVEGGLYACCHFLYYELKSKKPAI